jgi:hypothetical protein
LIAAIELIVTRASGRITIKLLQEEALVVKLLQKEALVVKLLQEEALVDML